MVKNPETYVIILHDGIQINVLSRMFNWNKII
jgi:hypothetical protein